MDRHFEGQLHKQDTEEVRMRQHPDEQPLVENTTANTKTLRNDRLAFDCPCTDQRAMRWVELTLQFRRLGNSD